MDTLTEVLAGCADIAPRRSPTCEMLMELVARAEEGEDIASLLASEAERIELFLTWEPDDEFEVVRSIEDLMRASLLLYQEGCSFLSGLDTTHARERFLAADRLMRHASNAATEAQEDVWSNVQAA